MCWPLTRPLRRSRTLQAPTRRGDRQGPGNGWSNPRFCADAPHLLSTTREEDWQVAHRCGIRTVLASSRTCFKNLGRRGTTDFPKAKSILPTSPTVMQYDPKMLEREPDVRLTRRGDPETQALPGAWASTEFIYYASHGALALTAQKRSLQAVLQRGHARTEPIQGQGWRSDERRG
jgi:hypothetical protein